MQNTAATVVTRIISKVLHIQQVNADWTFLAGQLSLWLEHARDSPATGAYSSRQENLLTT